MFAHGIARTGYIQIPSTSDLVFEFLPVSWTSIQHYGVNVGTLRYNGDGLTDFRNTRSPYLGRHAGKWPIRYNPDDATAVWFRNPDSGGWHRLDWEHARRLTQPFSFEALGYTKRLAAAQDRFPDTVGALDDLLGRWNIGLCASPAERRMALRLASQRAALELPAPPVTTLPSVRAALAGTGQEDDGADELLQPHLVVDVGDQGPPTPPLPVHLSTPDEDVEVLGGDDDDEDEVDLVDLDSDFNADAVEPLLHRRRMRNLRHDRHPLRQRVRHPLPPIGSHQPPSDGHQARGHAAPRHPPRGRGRTTWLATTSPLPSGHGLPYHRRCCRPTPCRAIHPRPTAPTTGNRHRRHALSPRHRRPTPAPHPARHGAAAGA